MTKNEVEKMWNELGNFMIYGLVICTGCIIGLIYAFGAVMLPLWILLAGFFALPFLWCFMYGFWEDKGTIRK